MSLHFSTAKSIPVIGAEIRAVIRAENGGVENVSPHSPFSWYKTSKSCGNKLKLLNRVKSIYEMSFLDILIATHGG